MVEQTIVTGKEQQETALADELLNGEKPKVEAKEPAVVTEAKIEPEKETPQEIVTKAEDEFTEDDILGVSNNEPEQKQPSEFEMFTSDPLNKAFVEWRNNGGVDFNDFTAQVGYKKTPTEIKELLTEELKADPLLADLGEDEFNSALEDKLYKYESMNPKRQEAYLKDLQNKHAKGHEGVYREFSEKIQTQRALTEQGIQQAKSELRNVVNTLVGKKFHGMVAISKEDVNAILAEAERQTPNKYSKDGKIETDAQGRPLFDVKTGVNNALWVLYGKVLVNEAKKVAEAKGKEMIVEKRLNTGNQEERPSITAPTGSADEGVKRLREKMKG